MTERNKARVVMSRILMVGSKKVNTANLKVGDVVVQGDEEVGFRTRVVTSEGGDGTMNIEHRGLGQAFIIPRKVRKASGPIAIMTKADRVLEQLEREMPPC